MHASSSIMKWIFISLVGSSVVGFPIHSVPVVVEIADSLDSPISDASDWIELARINLSSAKKSSWEIDLHLETSSVGLLGSIVDWFDPPEFDLVFSDKARQHLVYNDSFFANAVDISWTTSEDAFTSPIFVLFRNRNILFKQTPVVSGQAVSNSDVFDLRSRYPQCTFPVYMQGLCGACYADVVAGAGTDAVCLSEGTPISQLSPQPMVSCGNLGGCAGGSPYLAALWTQHHGLVDQATCPYVSDTCEPDKDEGKNGCVKCDRIGFERMLNVDTYWFRPVVIASDSESAMRRHLEASGSVMVIFEAHANFQEFFVQHPFRVYVSTEDSPSLGNHAVRIIGYGIDQVENIDNNKGSHPPPTKYWIAVNSWGSSWGDRGTFKILRGENICDIEKWPVGIEYLPNAVAGMSESQEMHHNPTVGAWKKQDSSSAYWRGKIDQWRDSLNNLLVNAGDRSEDMENSAISVKSIETRVGHGFSVKLVLEGAKVFVHVHPDGSISFELDDKKRVKHPQRNIVDIM